MDARKFDIPLSTIRRISVFIQTQYRVAYDYRFSDRFSVISTEI